jgi:chitin disaccharide deacetylase
VAAPAPVLLCADDYAMTAGISRSIEELAAIGHLSATSAMTTTRHWPADAPRVRDLRGLLSVGLHLNFTLGAPAGTMPRLAPSGPLPNLNALIARALARQLDAAEIRDEIRRQLDAFESALGAPPDHVGHQHVQVLPVIRTALIEELSRRYWSAPPLVRDPADRRRGGLPRSIAAIKARVANGLAAGFAQAVRARGLEVNTGFSGFSAFDPTQSYADELAAEFEGAGARHIVMCHPGHNDAELATLDPVTARRDQEHAALRDAEWLRGRLWHPSRAADGPPVDWQRAWPSNP